MSNSGQDASKLDIAPFTNLDIKITNLPKHFRPEDKHKYTFKHKSHSDNLMPLPPYTTPVPQPVFMPGMSHQVSESTPAPPAATPLPIRRCPSSELKSGDKKNKTEENGESSSSSSSSSSSEKAQDTSDSSSDGDGNGKTSKKEFPLPKLRIRIDDITHPGTKVFLDAVDATECLPRCVRSVMRQLYVSPGAQHLHPTPTRSVTLILREMPGVAYTTGIDIDDDHKEIHFSLEYIAKISAQAGMTADRRTAEINGVLVHELVHCYQWNAHGTCPGGLIEGVADWVRLQCDLAPPHWHRGDGTGEGDKDAGWDAGYQRTGFFLDYLESRFGEGTVRRLNEKLRTERKYENKRFWTELLGRPVEQLWEDYKESLKKDKDGGGGGDKGGNGNGGGGGGGKDAKNCCWCNDDDYGHPTH